MQQRGRAMSELTIEQMRQIIDGAPDWAKGYNTAIQKYTRSVWFSQDVLLSDLKTQIDQHYYGQSEEKELEQYEILSQEKIEGGAVLVGHPNIQKMSDFESCPVCREQMDQCLNCSGGGMSEFEKWFKTTSAYRMLEAMNYYKMDLFHWVEGRGEYRHSSVQIAFMTWAEKQSEIDQLKAENLRLSGLLKEQKRCFDECSQMVSDLIKERDQLKAKKAGLEERTNKALQMLKDWDDQTFRDDFEQLIGELGDVLRGECE